MQVNQARVFYILHFNDVYDIELQQKEPKGGASRFVRVVNTLQKYYGDQIITLFSGDIFSPSQLSTIYKGSQMILPLQRVNVDIACLGNHDFDYNLEELRSLMVQSNTTWVLSNVINVETKRPLADAEYQAFKSIDLGGKPFRICFVGLAEEEWLGQITEIPQKIMQYEDFVSSSNRILEHQKDNYDMAIALTHMRIPNDLNLIDQNPHVNLVLGGHDHIWYTKQEKQAFYLKSGTNFRNLGLIRVTIGDEVNNISLDQWSSQVESILKTIVLEGNNKYSFFEKMEHHQISGFGIDFIGINIISDIFPDQEIEEFVNEKIEVYNIETLKTIGYTDVDLETRFTKVRYEETNMLNFYTDLIRAEYETEIALINSGMIRADELLSSGAITYQTINKIFAIPDILVSYRITGKNLHETLENGVSKWPAYDGRFLAVSGITIQFDPQKPAGQRIMKQDILINGEEINYTRVYRVVTKNYVATGYDGFRHVEQKDFIIDDTLGQPCIQLVNQFFEMARKSQSIRKLSSQTEEYKENGMVRKISNEEVLSVIKPDDYHDERYQKFHHIIKEIRIIDNEPYVVISPQVEGRIKIKN